MRQFLTRPIVISVLLFIQVIPLLLFPASSFVGETQEWWLPALLAVLILIASFQLVFRHSLANWPWYLVSFGQGFNIISRLMLLMPNTTHTVNGAQVFYTEYVVLTILSIVISWLFLFYMEWPEVRIGVLGKIRTAQ